MKHIGFDFWLISYLESEEVLQGWLLLNNQVEWRKAHETQVCRWQVLITIISYYLSQFLWSFLHFSAFLSISMHFSTLLCISVHFTLYILGQFDREYRRPMDAILKDIVEGKVGHWWTRTGWRPLSLIHLWEEDVNSTSKKPTSYNL